MRPVVALDVDGVLNAGGLEEDGFVVHNLHVPVEDVPDSPFIRGGGTKPMDVTVRLHPAHGEWITSLREHADVVWATTWEHAANLYLAPLLGIDPLPLGLSVTGNPPMFGYVKNGDTGAWKASALADNFLGRPLAWVDDMANSSAYEAVKVESTQHLVSYRDERALAAARRYGWEDRIVPAAHYEDSWASGGFVVGSDWSTIVHGSAFRSRRGDPSPTLVVQTAARVGLTPTQMEAVTSFVREHAVAQDTA